MPLRNVPFGIGVCAIPSFTVNKLCGEFRDIAIRVQDNGIVEATVGGFATPGPRSDRGRRLLHQVVAWSAGRRRVDKHAENPVASGSGDS